MKALILLDERILTNLDPKGEITKSAGTGNLYIRNPSQSTTLWSIKLSSSFGPAVRGLENQEIPHLQPGKEYLQSYEFGLDSNLIVTERIDTLYTDDVTDLNTSRNTVVKGFANKVLFEIQLKNKYNFPLVDIALTKSFDASLIECKPVDGYDGTVNSPSNPLKWTLDRIEVGETKTLKFVVTLTPQSSEKIKTGEIVVTGQGSGLLTDINPAIDSECDNVDLSVDVIESDSPGIWKILINYTNASEFETLFETLNVKSPEIQILDLKVDTVFNPNADAPSWSKEEPLNSSDYPEITKDFKYRAVHEVQSHVDINIHKETDLLEVVEMNAEKHFDPPEVKTYTRMPVNYTIEIPNLGTAQIGRIELEETIPPYLMVHALSVTGGGEYKIDVKIEGMEGLDEKETQDISSRQLSGKRQLLATITLAKYSPGNRLIVSFDCTAEKPKPNLDYTARSIVKAYAVSPTIPYEIQSKMSQETPELKVKFAKRSFKSTTNYKGIADNEYEVTIEVVNTGEVPLHNIFINHKIQGGDYKRHEPVTVTAKELSGEIEYFIKNIDTGSTMSLITIVGTDGPIRQTQPKVRIAD